MSSATRNLPPSGMCLRAKSRWGHRLTTLLVSTLMSLPLVASAPAAQAAVGIFEYSLVNPSTPIGITTGPEGNMWFTEFGGEKIGRITTAGAISEYPIPTTSGQPEEITAGPDDSLWFTERNSGKIGRISTAGVIAEFPLPSSESGPWGINTGPDGDIWFAETAGRIGRLDLTEADLGVTKSDTGSDPVEVGQSVTYTLTATNNGPQTAEGVTLKDTLPAGLQFASASAGCAASGTTPDVVTCDLGTLTAGSTAIRTITTTATTGGLHTDTAAVAGAVSDPVPANDLVSETTTVDPNTCFGEQPTIIGTPGDDRITGTPARDVILARAGNDTVDGGAGNDLICGGRGADTVTGGPGNDRISGDAGNDILHARPATTP
ncbi:isopeptide-forming domain-containing fimbrial protein [Streptomyces sp. NBC_00161]|uniref:virginiamycin B lyase family protein n=1 Tax=Streptomyces sp. NBC_00161 TaxID=2975671 RepID=UPI003251EA42